MSITAKSVFRCFFFGNSCRLLRSGYSLNLSTTWGKRAFSVLQSLNITEVTGESPSSDARGRCTLQSFHKYSTRCTSISTDSSLGREWTEEVEKFGSLHVESNVKTRIMPIDPLAVPDGNLAFVTLTCSDRFKVDRSVIERMENGLARAVSLDKNCAKLTVQFLEDKLDLLGNLELCIRVPFPYNVSGVQHGEQPVYIERLENEKITLSSKTGDITFSNLKCTDVDMITSGNISATGYLVGNARMKCTQSGGIHVRKLQGGHVTLSCESGRITAMAIYSKAVKCTTLDGGISIMSSHGNLKCHTESGNIDVAAVSGTAMLTSKLGDIAATLDRTDHLTSETDKGNITLRVPPGSELHISASGKSIEYAHDLNLTDCRTEQDDDIKRLEATMGKGKASIHLQAPQGKIQVSVKDWLTSMKGFENVPR